MKKSKRQFCLVLVKPSHYDNEGYVIQWFRSAIPSNSLACLYGLALECAENNVLGEDVEFQIHAFDETNSHIDTKKIISLIEKADDGMVMLVGVQSNQFPRALDIAKPLREKNIKTAIGGFHVSGTMAMLKERDAHVEKALEMGVTLFAGEAEGRLAQVLIDACENKLASVYNFMDDLPNIEGVATPLLPAERVHLTAGATTSFDAGRGCPFSCSFCTIINVQGRKSRRRSPDDIEKLIRANVAQGLHSFFITDDNFARNKDWEIILDKLIDLREDEKLKISFIIQVDTLCHKLPNFIEKSKRAGVKRVFIGLENINPDSLLGASKRQNKITDYRDERVTQLGERRHHVAAGGGRPTRVRRGDHGSGREAALLVLDRLHQAAHRVAISRLVRPPRDPLGQCGMLEPLPIRVEREEIQAFACLVEPAGDGEQLDAQWPEPERVGKRLDHRGRRARGTAVNRRPISPCQRSASQRISQVDDVMRSPDTRGLKQEPERRHDGTEDRCIGQLPC